MSLLEEELNMLKARSKRKKEGEVVYSKYSNC